MASEIQLGATLLRRRQPPAPRTWIFDIMSELLIRQERMAPIVSAEQAGASCRASIGPLAGDKAGDWACVAALCKAEWPSEWVRRAGGHIRAGRHRGRAVSAGAADRMQGSTALNAALGSAYLRPALVQDRNTRIISVF